ncbi:MAG: SLC13 family permease [Bacteroidales bacterium]|nr:SLC13 family permease [Bacteroidales bacterium]
MTLELVVVTLVLVFIIISLYTELIGPAFTFLIGIIVLGLFKILTPKEIMNGLGNDQVAVLIMLLLLGDIIRKTDLIDNLLDRVFRRTLTYQGFLVRMTFLVSGLSAFMNDTPLVAIMMPYVRNWSKRNNIKPSKLLIPLSFAAILGGSATLIGTSTNLIMNGMVKDPTIIPGLAPLGLFDFSVAGLPMILIGSLYLILFSNRLLPERKDAMSDFSSESRQYLVEAEVRPGSAINGKTIEQANLRNLSGLFLVEIYRGEEHYTAVSPNMILQEGDVLVFAGDTATIAEMINSNSGLTLKQVGMYKRKRHTQVMELVISQNATLVSKTVRESNFRSLFDAAILAIHRNGERIPGKIGNVRLKAGDVLLVLAGDDFMERSRVSNEFYLLSRVAEFRKLKWYKNLILFGGAATAIITSALGLISLFMALLILMILILALKITTPKELPKSIDYNLAIIIVLAMALGTAMIKTGFADLIATGIIEVIKPLGAVGLLAGIFIITNLLASYITVKAAAAIIFPISVTAAIQMGLPAMPFVLIVAHGAAANFITPMGFQTNLMVYGPGGYNFKDYIKIGWPLTLMYFIVSVLTLSWWYDLF